MLRTCLKSKTPRIGAKTLYIEPGSPWENGYCESFSGKLRDELLNGEIDLLQPEGSHRCYRALAQALQHDQTALIAELPATGAADIVAGSAASGSERGYAVVSISLVQNIRQVKSTTAKA